MTTSPQWEEKCWGKTRLIVGSEYYSKHELQVEAGGFCSFHYHRNRSNIFTVREGHVRVVSAYGWQLQSVGLLPGDRYVIRAGIPHQFQVIASGIMEEEYAPDPGPVYMHDIVRITTGGVVASEKGFNATTDPAIWTGAHTYWINGCNGYI